MNRNQLIAYAYRYEGDVRCIRKALERQEAYETVKLSCECITILDEEYPECLKELYDPPYVLFIQGNKAALKKRMISVVGSREPSAYAIRMTSIWVKRLSHAYTIVSGLAKGIDGLAHHVAIKQGTTVAVLGFGFEILYPKEHQALYTLIKNEHCVISEYPPHTPVRKHQFIARNRIIAALGERCLLMQAKVNSGSMHTVQTALDLGREIDCLPFHADEMEGQGNNLLIQQGANILTNFE